MTPKILAFAGSTRTDSFNKKTVRIAANGARSAGADVTVIDLRDFPMPLYDGDLEAKDGLPVAAIQLKRIFGEHHGLLISSPEYNSAFSGVLKNAIDWLSRSSPGEPPFSAFDKKVAAIMSASPGALGGLRGLVGLRSLLSNIKILVLPQQIAVSKAGDAFNVDGTMKDTKQQAALEKLGADVVDVVRKLNG